MCIPEGKPFKVKLNEKGEGWGWKLFTREGERLRPLVELLPFFQRGRWIKSESGPGFFLFPTKKEAKNDRWQYSDILKIKFRKIKHAKRWGILPLQEDNRIIIAEEIFIPIKKEAT